MSELKPCPFCGGEAEPNVLNTRREKYYSIWCKKCDAGITHYHTEEEALKFWNQRMNDKDKSDAGT